VRIVYPHPEYAGYYYHFAWTLTLLLESFFLLLYTSTIRVIGRIPELLTKLIYRTTILCIYNHPGSIVLLKVAKGSLYSTDYIYNKIPGSGTTVKKVVNIITKYKRTNNIRLAE
jgi:hypothetical protein